MASAHTLLRDCCSGTNLARALQGREGNANLTRFLEAGFLPAGLYTLSQWYKNAELSRRFAIFFAGYLFGQAVNGLLAYAMSVSPYHHVCGILHQLIVISQLLSLHMRGIGNLAGWQWLFLVSDSEATSSLP